MRTILITGGTGLIGSHLANYLVSKGYYVIILTRSLEDKVAKENIEYALWDIKKKMIDLAALQKADGIIHLAGAGVVDKKWTEKYKKLIVYSRTETIKLIIDSLAKITHKVKVLVSASAIGWYGEDTRKGFAFTEDDPAAGNFLGRACLLWEESVDAAKSLGIRVCKLRTGIVLSEQGGALAEFNKPLKFGIAAILGNGKQMISWIHINDLCRMYRYAVEEDAMHGSFNAVAPSPVTNKELTLALAKEKRGRFFIPVYVPAFILKLILGKRSEEILKSTTVSCKKIKQQGFTFLYPSVQTALQNLFSKKNV